MDQMAEEQLNYGDEEHIGAQKMQYQGGGTISALADDEIIGEDDEYDDLYNDVNVGEGFLQLQRSEEPVLAAGQGNGGLQVEKTSLAEPRTEAAGSQQLNIHGIATEGKYSNSGIHFPESKEGLTADRGQVGTTGSAQKGRFQGMTHDAQEGNLGFQGSTPMPHKPGFDYSEMSVKVAAESAPLLNSGAGGPRSAPQMPVNQINMSVNMNVRGPTISENQIRPAVENCGTMLFVGELHWWTTDAELESVLSQYGRVKDIKFFDERASGKSKGYCQVEFYDAAAAAACKERMNGHVLNGRACVVAFASPQTIKQMAASYMNKCQVQPQSQSQLRRPMNDGVGRGGGMNQSSGDAVRGYGRGGWGRGGQGMLNRGPGGGHMRGRRGGMAAKNMVASTSGVGSGVSGGAYEGGLAGPAFGGPVGGLMHPQGMMGAGFDPTYTGRGAGYGGFSGPPFPGMVPSFPAVNSMGLPGVASHVNPAFFGRGIAANGMGMMGPTGMDGHHPRLWTDSSMGGWGGEEQERRTRESSYGGEDEASEYGYGEASLEKGVRSNAASWEKERGSEHDWSGNSGRRYCDEREMERERSDRNHRYREHKDGYRDHRQRERQMGYEDDRDKGQSYSRSHSRSKGMAEEDHRRSRDTDYGKRRRLPS